ncbi:MAG: DUF433 domain-containing protein [Isosphaeraceae bacterium]
MSQNGNQITELIINRGRGPELKGTRVTVYLVMDYVRAGAPPQWIAQELDLSADPCSS